MKNGRRTAKVTWRGKQYEVTGRYYAGFLGNRLKPSETSIFEVHGITGIDGSNVLDLDLFDGDEERAELERKCIRQIEEDSAYAEQEAAERKYDEIKERSA